MRRDMLNAALLAGALAMPLGAARAAELPQVSPAEVGLDQAALDRLGARLTADTEAGTIPGAVVLILRDGKIGWLEAFGQRDAAAGDAMETGDIFRIYSMTKPLTSVAAMQLVEEGKLSLTDPVATYFPSFADVQIATETKGADGKATIASEAPARAGTPTIHDLMRHTAGLSYGVFGSGAVRSAYLEAGIASEEISAQDKADKMGDLPLHFQPGTGWEYSRATDVLGAVVEKVAGKPLGEVFEERIFQPLGMTDTAFWVEDEGKRSRVAAPLADDTGRGDALLDATRAPVFESGGGGLFSTAGDYARFVAAMMNGGELDGARILAPETVAYMITDHLGDIPHKAPEGASTIGYLPGPGYGFGLGFAVRTDHGVAPLPGRAGEYYWSGYAGTYFWVDPENDMAVIYMMQSPKQRLPYRALLRNMIYPAVLPLEMAAGN